jgi:hypothetical protein
MRDERCVADNRIFYAEIRDNSRVSNTAVNSSPLYHLSSIIPVHTSSKSSLAFILNITSMSYSYSSHTSSTRSTRVRLSSQTSDVAGNDAEYGSIPVHAHVHPPLPRRRRRKLRISVMICCLASCASFLLCDSFLLNDRNINNMRMLQPHRLSQSLRAVVKDKTKDSKKEKASTESKRSGYRLGLFPYLYRFDKSKTRKMSSSTPDVTTQQLTIGENATNSTTSPPASTDTPINVTAQAGKDVNTKESKADLIDKPSNSTNILGDRPELAKSTSSNATNANAKANNAVNTITTSDSKDAKAEAEISWQDKYMNLFYKTEKPSTSASASPKQVNSSRGSGSKTPLASVVSQKQVNRTLSNKESKEPTSPLVPGKKPSDVLTVEDLESFLLTNGFVKRSELEASQKAMSSANALSGAGAGKSRGSTAPTFKTDGSSGSGVALPQPSVLGYKDLKWGTAVSAGFLGMLVGLSILPNLWFMGTLAGFLYGWDVGKKIPDGSPSNALNNLIVNLGRNLAKSFLAVYDATNAIFFMYKTGELSYAYYKRFSVLDDKFKINAKIDAWNSRFAEGKVAFDAWERENEIGRKALATMRTIWLVEERSLKKSSKRRRQSRYRPIQFFYDAAFSMGRLCRSTMKVCAYACMRYVERVPASVLKTVRQTKCPAHHFVPCPLSIRRCSRVVVIVNYRSF